MILVYIVKSGKGVAGWYLQTLLNISRFDEYLRFIYPNELEVKDTTDTQKSASYFDLHIEIDNGGRLKTKLYNVNKI
jgi:hypothetical protein